MDPRDLHPPPEHPYFVSSRPEKRRDKKIGELQSNLSKEDADFLYCFRKKNQYREILLEEFFILFDSYDYIPTGSFQSAFQSCKSYFEKKQEEEKKKQEEQKKKEDEAKKK